MSTELPSWAAGYQQNNPLSAQRTSAQTPPSTPSPQEPAQRFLQSQPPSQSQRASGGLVIADPAARIEGRFETAETVEIGCELTGEISSGRFVVRDTGNVHATVHTTDATISGRFDGDLIARGTVEIQESARVGGNVRCNSLVIARGAVFTGNVQWGTDEAESVVERRSTAPILAVELQAAALPEVTGVEIDPSGPRSA